MSLSRQKEGLAEDRSRDEKTQLIVGCIGSAADIIEFVSETVGDVPDQLCNGNLLQKFQLIKSQSPMTHREYILRTTLF